MAGHAARLRRPLAGDLAVLCHTAVVPPTLLSIANLFTLAIAVFF